MSALTRLSLSIQRLHSRHLFPFDATPLLRLLTHIDETYHAHTIQHDHNK
jgi:hypothetical protein